MHDEPTASCYPDNASGLFKPLSGLDQFNHDHPCFGKYDLVADWRDVFGSRCPAPVENGYICPRLLLRGCCGCDLLFRFPRAVLTAGLGRAMRLQHRSWINTAFCSPIFENGQQSTFIRLGIFPFGFAGFWLLAQN